jgi:hypothetical protein
MVQQAREALANVTDSDVLLDDGPEPDLRPPDMPGPTVSPKDEADNDTYKQAVAALDRLTTKTVERWIDLLPVEQVQRVEDMLHAIVERIRRARAA